jgi:membrane-anchored mycosin MYCP
VIDRIEQTAVHPAAAGGRDDYVGYGLIDPVAALTRVLPADTGTVTTSPGSLPVARAVAVSGRSRAFALTGALVVLAALVVLGVGLQSLRTRRRRARARVRAQLIRREAASAITPVRPPRSPVP